MNISFRKNFELSNPNQDTTTVLRFSNKFWPFWPRRIFYRWLNTTVAIESIHMNVLEIYALKIFLCWSTAKFIFSLKSMCLDGVMITQVQRNTVYTIIKILSHKEVKEWLRRSDKALDAWISGHQKKMRTVWNTQL